MTLLVASISRDIFSLRAYEGKVPFALTDAKRRLPTMSISIETAILFADTIILFLPAVS